MYSVILAGWWGTRLYPLSTEENPKQFIAITDDKSLLQNTVERVLHFSDAAHIGISTTRAYKDKTLEQLKIYGVDTIISEPERRNTAPAIAYIIRYLEHKKHIESDALILVCPADHHISPVEAFVTVVQKGIQYAENWKIVLFGIKPDAPETGYGYIKADTIVEKFTEKPDLETAQRYLAEGGYFWNAGIFMFRIDTMKEEFKTFAPEIHAHMSLPFDEFVTRFSELPKISIDYAVMEKTKNCILIPMDLQRSDLGSRDAVRKYGRPELLIEFKDDKLTTSS
jgi:mannose-1-phosphate guanylyltransferase / mannose-6-phosphate isomerase